MIILTDDEVSKLREAIQYAIVIKAMGRHSYQEALAILDAAPTVEPSGWFWRDGYALVSEDDNGKNTPLYARTGDGK